MAYEQDPATLDRIAAIWADTLAVPAVVADDNFFGLGGDSIMVTIMTMRVEQDFDVIVDPDLVFDNPTLSAFVQALFTATQP